ncbi:MAG: hypothetical protein NT122_06750 [Solirubrobacterales bacterium]|nr:hypothetical protein [Solirubrobacterales bacterium]
MKLRGLFLPGWDRQVSGQKTNGAERATAVVERIDAECTLTRGTG